MDRRDRPALDGGGQSLTLGIVKLGRVARRLAVDQPGRPPGVEAQNPVADRLQTDPADPRRVGAGTPVADLRKREKPARLRRVLRALRKPPQIGPVEFIPKPNRSSHGEPPSGSHHGFRLSRLWESPT